MELPLPALLLGGGVLESRILKAGARLSDSCLGSLQRGPDARNQSKASTSSRRLPTVEICARRSSHGAQDGYAARAFDSRRIAGGELNTDRYRRRGENELEIPLEKNWPEEANAGESSSWQGKGNINWRTSSSKEPHRTSQAVVAHSSQSLAHRSARHSESFARGSSTNWNEAGSSWSKVNQRDFIRGNPLIEQIMKDAEAFDEYEDSDDYEDDLDVLDDDSSFREVPGSFDARAKGGSQNSAMGRIVERLGSIPGSRSIYQSRNLGGGQKEVESEVRPKYEQEIFPTAGRGWTTPDHPVPSPAAPSNLRKSLPETSFPWEFEDGTDDADTARDFPGVNLPSLAELTLPEDELKRLRSLGVRMRSRVKVKEWGVTNKVIQSIHREWSKSEVVRIKCLESAARNMRRTHDALEEKTGGLVVWREGGACLLYRGKDYIPPPPGSPWDTSEESPLISEGQIEDDDTAVKQVLDGANDVDQALSPQPAQQCVFVPRVSDVYDPELEDEMEEILSTLGPRYDDWTGMKPVPVDADLLVGPSGGFRESFRLMPFGVKPGLTNLEMTSLRKLARPVPPHFALGRNRGLEGLAAAIVKLWEKSEIAKIAVKRGVQNTNHEIMARELKRLTGGVLLARDTYFIVLYRGKDFLPPSVAAALENRQEEVALTTTTTATSSLEEETATSAFKDSEADSDVYTERRHSAETSAETATVLEAEPNSEIARSSDGEDEDRKSNREEDFASVTGKSMAKGYLHRKLSITLAKKHKAEAELQKVEKRLAPAGPPEDREMITDEERYMYRRLGLKMHAFLLLGKRGVYGGTVENMHLHWKHRELVKIIYKAKNKVDLEQTARMLEYESGGILVGTLPTNKGQAIILHRGKNYQRPPELRPRNLLTKRDALKRSIEMQRQESLAKHLLSLEKDVDTMQVNLSNLGRREGVTAADERALNRPDQETKDRVIHAPSKNPEDGDSIDSSVLDSRKPAKLDAIFRADPLSRREKLILRQQALKERKKAAHFNVGRSNVVAGLTRAIRAHFRRHALVKVGVRGRARGTPVEEILYQLEEATGGTLVSQEHSKLILYRGWPEGQQSPTEENGHWEKLSWKLRNAMISEEEADDDYLLESDLEGSRDEDDREKVTEEDQDEILPEAQVYVESSESDYGWFSKEDDGDETDANKS